MIARELMGHAYVIRPEDLRVEWGVCGRCGGPKPLLVPVIPEGLPGVDYTHAPSTALVTSYTKWIRPHADHETCSHCELASWIGREFPPSRPHPFEDPSAAELRRLREELARRDQDARPAPEPELPGELFKVGKVFVTRAAALALGRTDPRCTEPDGSATDPIGRARAPEFLGRHVAGDFGSIGRLKAANADLGAKLGPVAPEVDRNAASLAAGRGTVRSLYSLERRERPKHQSSDYGLIEKSERVTERHEVAIRTELGSAPMSLLYVPHTDRPE